MPGTFIDEAVEQYAEKHSEAPDALLKELTQVTFEKAQSPQMQVGPLEGAFLRMLVRLTQAKRVLEVGTFTGYSALCMAEGLPADGSLITCDQDEKVLAIAESFFARSPHGKKIQIERGDARKTLHRLEAPFDLVFLDADKESYVDYYEMALPLLKPHGLIAADNTLWSGRVLKPQADVDQAVVRFNEHVLKDNRVEKVVLTVRDGVTLAWKR
jgi:caffeoyl-CoA O-methyltransferase